MAKTAQAKSQTVIVNKFLKTAPQRRGLIYRKLSGPRLNNEFDAYKKRSKAIETLRFK